MAKNLISILCVIFLSCEINSKQIIKPEKLNFNEIKFNAVTKKLIYSNLQEDADTENMKKIIQYWYDNKIKTDGFDGSLEVNVKKIKTDKIKEEDYFKFTINLVIEFIEEGVNLSRSKKYTITTQEFGDIKGSFTINDQERLIINIMYQSLVSISNKLEELI